MQVYLNSSYILPITNFEHLTDDVTGSDTLSNSLNMSEGIESLSIRDHCANDPDRFQVYEVNKQLSLAEI